MIGPDELNAALVALEAGEHLDDVCPPMDKTTMTLDEMAHAATLRMVSAYRYHDIHGGWPVGWPMVEPGEDPWDPAANQRARDRAAALRMPGLG